MTDILILLQHTLKITINNCQFTFFQLILLIARCLNENSKIDFKKIFLVCTNVSTNDVIKDLFLRMWTIVVPWQREMSQGEAQNCRAV